MSESEPSKINYSESELNSFVKRAAEVLNAYFYKQLIESAGKREIKSETIEALAKYWVVSIAKYLDFLTSAFLNYGAAKALDTLKAVTGTDEELIKYFLYHFDKRDLGLKEYSECLGFDIEKFIDEKITPNGKQKFKILDIGCAEGVFLEQLEKKYGNKVEVWGLANGYEGAEGKDGINFKLGLMELMPEEFDSKFDLVTTLNAVMYSADPQLAFDQSINSLNKNGVLLFACGTVKPVFSDKAVSSLLNTTPTVYEQDFFTKHRSFYKKMESILQQKIFRSGNREFQINEMEPSQTAWTPVVYKITRVN